MDEKVGTVLVVGGGIGGVQASLDLAEMGYFVYLLDSSAAIGGVMAQLDKTFPTNDCSMCILSPKLVETGRHLNIRLITNAEVRGVEGKAGNFLATISRKPRYIDTNKCTGCGECAKHCPIKAINLFNQGLSARSAVYVPFPQAIPRAFVIDRNKCIGCGLCEKLCLAGAVKYEDEEQIETLNVGAVILCPGYQLCDMGAFYQYGYTRYLNVVTSLEFERMLSASGPFVGRLLRPSDREIPQRIAFIQCVGSRDKLHPYCSSVCCTYAVKEAIVAKEHAPINLKETIFFMDMRTYGKDFERYYDRAREEYGIQFVRSKIFKVEERDGTGNLAVKYLTEDNEMKSEEFELVVLSAGFQPSPESVELARKLKVQLNKYGFCHTDSFSPVETSRPGIYVCGAFQGPKDIPETVMQASGAAGSVSMLLAPARNTLTTKKEYPAEKDVSEEEPRIGVFICHCGINIGGYVDVPDVTKFAKTLPNIVYAENNLYTCSQDTQERIKTTIKEYNLNRVVVASCTPRTHEPLFRETIREAGLNPYLFEMANIRDQCSWVHMHEPEKATEKAEDLVKIAVAKARLLEPLKPLSLPVTRSALVIGGGVAGMTSALTLAEQGLEVCIIERSNVLGGVVKRIHYNLDGEDVQQFLDQLIKQVQEHPKIRVYTDTWINMEFIVDPNFTEEQCEKVREDIKKKAETRRFTPIEEDEPVEAEDAMEEIS